MLGHAVTANVEVIIGKPGYDIVKTSCDTVIQKNPIKVSFMNRAVLTYQ